MEEEFRGYVRAGPVAILAIVVIYALYLSLRIVLWGLLILAEIVFLGVSSLHSRHQSLKNRHTGEPLEPPPGG